MSDHESLKLHNAVNLLARHDTDYIDDIKTNSKLYKAYNLIKSYVNSDDHRILNKIVDQQYKPSYTKPGTVGAFLFGCGQTTYGEVNQSCSPLCIGNVNILKGASCDDQVWVLATDNSPRFLQIYDSGEVPGRALIFVPDDFGGFTPEEIDLFKSRGVSQAQLFNTFEGKHFVKLRTTPLSKLPVENVNIGELNNTKTVNSNIGVNLDINKIIKASSNVNLGTGTGTKTNVDANVDADVDDANVDNQTTPNSEPQTQNTSYLIFIAVGVILFLILCTILIQRRQNR